MQQPTLTNVHIRSVQDAHKLFYAVQLGLLPKIEKRLDAHERNALRPGNVYVWEERAPSTDSFSVSMERFTEGKSWTASRVREDFLMYFESQRKPKGRTDAQRAKSSENQVVRPGEHDQFIKQTYSVYRDDPAELSKQDEKEKPRKPRKWHLNAYFTKLTEGQLRTIDDIPMLRDLEVPEGTFTSARTNKPGKKGEVRGAASGVKRTFAPFPSSAPSRRLPPPDLQPQPVASTSTSHLPFPTGLSSPSSPESAMGMAPLTNAPVQVQPHPHPHQRSLRLPRTQSAQHALGHAAPQPVTPQLQIQIPAAVRTSTSLSLPSFAPHPHALHPPQSLADYPEREKRLSLAPSFAYTYAASPARSHSSHSSASWGSAARSPSASSSHSHSGAASMSPPQPAIPLPETEWGPPNAPVPVLDDGTPYTPAPRSVPVHGREERALPPLVLPAASAVVPMDVDSPTSAAAAAGMDLAPLHSLPRSHPYRRCPADDRALRLLGVSSA